MILRSFESGGHNSEPQLGFSGHYNYMGKTYSVTPTLLEVVSYFELFGGYSIEKSTGISSDMTHK